MYTSLYSDVIKVCNDTGREYCLTLPVEIAKEVANDYINSKEKLGIDGMTVFLSNVGDIPVECFDFDSIRICLKLIYSVGRKLSLILIGGRRTSIIFM